MACRVDHLCPHGRGLPFLLCSIHTPFPVKNATCSMLAVEEFGDPPPCFLSVPAGCAAESLLSWAEETEVQAPPLGTQQSSVLAVCCSWPCSSLLSSPARVLQLFIRSDFVGAKKQRDCRGFKSPGCSLDASAVLCGMRFSNLTEHVFPPSSLVGSWTRGIQLQQAWLPAICCRPADGWRPLWR